MRLVTLRARDLRNLTDVSLEMGPGATVISGENGQGKTNLAEAMAYLATLDSFRGAPTDALIRVGADVAIVRATVVDTDGREQLVELELSRHGRNRVLVNKQRLGRTRELLGDVVLSVTVPHGLPLDQQEQLAVDLVAAGADIIQTEGGTSAKPFSAGSLGLIEKAAPTLAAAHSISRALVAADSTAPVLCASGLSAVTLPLAIAAGASGVGVGSAVNKLNDELAMVAVVRSLREALGTGVKAAV